MIYIDVIDSEVPEVYMSVERSLCIETREFRIFLHFKEKDGLERFIKEVEALKEEVSSSK